MFCFSMIFCNKIFLYKIKPPNFALGEKVIPSVDQFKYLGIIITVKNCDADLKRQMRKYYANTNMLLRKFSCCSPDVKCCMFKCFAPQCIVFLCGLTVPLYIYEEIKNCLQQLSQEDIKFAQI